VLFNSFGEGEFVRDEKGGTVREQGLKHRLMIIISVIFVLPSLVLCYVFYDQNITLSLSNVVLFCLITILAAIGVILVRYVFDAITATADFLRKATTGGEKLSLDLHHEAKELNDISESLNRLIERFEKTTDSLNQTQGDLRESQEKYRNILESIEEGYYEVDLAGNFTFFNLAVSRMLGYSAEELRGMNNRQYMAEGIARKAFSAYNEVFRTGIPKQHFDAELIRKNGDKLYAGTSISLMRNSLGQPVGFRGIILDITERKRMEEEIIALSITDHLTGLYNRRGFLTLAEQQMKVEERSKKEIALLFTDLDKMKVINDTLGHEKGDQALIEVASILREVFRKSDIIARVGGDEFAVFGIGTTQKDLDILKSRLQQQIDIHNAAENRDYSISLSVGTAFTDHEHPCSIGELMSKADTLMYEQKRRKQSQGSFTNGL